MTGLSSVRMKESALHRAFQLQPESVLGETATLLDLDCANFRLCGKSSRPDGVAVVQSGGMALVELKLDVAGRKPDTSPTRLAQAMRHRILFVSRHIGEECIRKVRWHYELRFLDENCTIEQVTASHDGTADQHT